MPSILYGRFDSVPGVCEECCGAAVYPLMFDYTQWLNFGLFKWIALAQANCIGISMGCADNLALQVECKRISNPPPVWEFQFAPGLGGIIVTTDPFVATATYTFPDGDFPVRITET